MHTTAMLALTLLLTAADPDTLPEEPILMIDAGGHTSGAVLLFSKDGQELITASPDKTIRVWNLETGTTARVPRPPIGHGKEGMLLSAALAPDSKTLAVAGYNEPGRKWSKIYLIDLETGEIRRVLKGHVDSIGALAFSPDGKVLASASRDKTAILWDVESGAYKQMLRGHTGFLVDVAFSPDGRQVATASYDKTARIWSVAEGRPVAVLQGHTDRLLCLDWSPDGRTIATSGFDQTLCLWNPDGSLRWRSYDLGNQVADLAFTRDSRQVLLGRGGANIQRTDCSFLDITTGQETLRFEEHTNSVGDVALSPDNRLAASVGGDNNEIYLWRPADGRVVSKFESRGNRIYAVGWSPDGQTIAWGNTNALGGDSVAASHPLERTFRIADLKFGDAPAASYRRALGQRGSETIATASAPADRESVTTYWQGQPMATFRLPRPNDKVLSVSMLSDQRAVVGTYEALYLIDTRSGKLLREFRGHTGGVWGVAPSPDGRYILSGSSDQTLRIWDPEREEPLLSLFVAGPDWIAWTSEGYFAASPGGERLVGWHVNRGPQTMAEFHPAAQFRKTLYRPDVIQRMLIEGRLARALDRADKARGVTQGRPTNVAEILPPKIAITSPEQTRVRVQEASIEVQAVARSVGDRPVTSLKLLLDGRPYQGQAGVKGVPNPRPGEVRETWVVDLSIGINRLAVQAESEVSKAISDPVEVVYLGQGARAADKPRRHLYALVIGVADYPASLKLHYAADDARKLEQALRANTGGLFDSVEVKPLTDAQATREEILRGLTWLKENMASANDVGIVFFSGHGQQDEDGNLYLLPVDVDLNDLFATGVPSEQIKRRLAGVTGQVVALFDACHSGAVGKLGELVRDLASDDCGVWIIASSRGDETSLENNSLKQGNFTQALVEGLSGKADSYKDGKVLISELQSYVYSRVVELSRDRQHPVSATPLVQPFVLAMPGAEAETERSAALPTNLPISGLRR